MGVLCKYLFFTKGKSYVLLYPQIRKWITLISSEWWNKYCYCYLLVTSLHFLINFGFLLLLFLFWRENIHACFDCYHLLMIENWHKYVWNVAFWLLRILNATILCQQDSKQMRNLIIFILVKKSLKYSTAFKSYGDFIDKYSSLFDRLRQSCAKMLGHFVCSTHPRSP